LAGENQTHAFRRKSLPRALLSRAFAAHGSAPHDMVLDEGALKLETQPIGIRTRVVVRATEPLDLEEVGRREGGTATERSSVNQRLGSRCVVSVHANAVVGNAWANATFSQFLGEALGHLPPGTLFIHRGFVFPKHRGKEVVLQLLARFWQRGRAAGLHTALRVVDRANAPALAAVRRMGVRFRSAPILKLPGLDPSLLGARSVRRSKA